MRLFDWCLVGAVGLMLACRPGVFGGEVQPVPVGLAPNAASRSELRQATAKPTALPADPFRACAIRALRGDYGQLKDWQRVAYQRGLDQGVTVRGRAWVTHYWPAEGRDGQVDCRGNACTSATLACNRLPYGTVVWLEAGPICGLRIVKDCGARRNDRQAKRYGADLWMDRWNPGPKGNYMSDYAVISCP